MNMSYVPPVRKRVQSSLIYLLLLVAFLAFAVGVYRGGVHVAELRPEEITVGELPSALLLSFIRMSASYLASLGFAYALGVAAARTRWGERIIIPSLDILQSVPVVGFFPAAITFFIQISNGHRLGVELAACFLIFTSMAWNIAFAVYESLKSLSGDQLDAIRSLGVRGSRRFWKLYVPVSIPRVVYNSILSWSNGWFFLVACEIFAVGPLRYHLPGIGSFLARSAEENNLRLVIAGLASLTTLILLLDFLVWRPASNWSERFRPTSDTSEEEMGFVLFKPLPQSLLSRLRFLEEPARHLLYALTFPLVWLMREVLSPLLWDLPASLLAAVWRTIEPRVLLLSGFARRHSTWVQWSSVIAGGLAAVWLVSRVVGWFRGPMPEFASDLPAAVLASTGRLVVALGLSLAWILPLVFWTWNRPRARRLLTTLAQIGAGLPAIALFPLFILVIVRHLGGGMEVASILLLMTGMQWYLLFNCIGGAAIIPAETAEATRSFGLGRWKTWTRLVLPSIRPALITGAITAWGGGWNALVVAEYVTFQGEVLRVKGIGALLNYSVYELGDNRSIMICVAAMVAWILFVNTIFWRPVYQSAIERYKFEE